MFKIGENIVYPLQGIGTIERIEEKKFSDEAKQYYIIKILNNNMEIMLPTDKGENLRLLSSPDTLDNLLSNMNNLNISDVETAHPKQRYQINMEKFKSGLIDKNAEVILNLTKMNKQKPLNTSEKKMLTNSRNFLIDEITLIKNISQQEASDLLDNSLN